MGRYSGKTCRLLAMLSLTLAFFIVEITVGFITNSLALVGDSYHMLSDVLALIVGFAAVKISKLNSSKNTFGWARAEVLGAMVNGVFLVALCFTIFIEALKRLVGDEHIENPDLLLIVGSIGLAVNLIGLLLFHHHSHGHSHGGHSHGGHGHSHGDIPDSPSSKELDPLHSSFEIVVDRNASTMESSSEDEGSMPTVETKTKKKKLKSTVRSAQLNMRAVFLHVLGDALGSVVVIVSALVIKFVKADWKYKVDPAMSLVMVVIILSTTIPLLKETAFILLQTVPGHIQVKQLQDKLIKKVQGVLAVHEFHIWQLTGNRIIATAHIRCQNLRDYKRIAEEVKEFFHNEGIHSTTIQPEFIENEDLTVNQGCVLECGPDKTCYPDTCCGSKVKKDKKNKDSPAQQTPDNKSSSTGSADSSEQDQNEQIPRQIDETGL